MNAVLMEVLNMSVMASIAAFAVIFVRLILKKTPKIFSYALWAIVLFKLLCPFKLESALSFLPSSANTVPQSVIYSQAPISPINHAPIINTANTVTTSVEPVGNPVDAALNIAAWVWLAGVVILLGYSFFSYLSLKLRLSTAALIHDNIWETDRIAAPFVLGFIKPRIYLPLGMVETDYILAHEQTHIRRYDYLIKPLAFFALCLHWFNPVVWLSYFLMCKDMEMSCDESVLKRLGGDIRASYSGSLLALSVKQSGLLSPLAFGESNTKSRIRNVLKYKKASIWIIISAVAAVVAVTVGFAATRAEHGRPLWAGMGQRSDWNPEQMHFNRITFGSERNYVDMRMGEPDYSDETMSHYYIAPVIYRSETGEETEVPDSDYDVTVYYDSPTIIEKKGIRGVYRLDLIGTGEMAGVNGEDAGTLAGVLREYGGPNLIQDSGNLQTLWYYDPYDPDRRMWFEVENGELNRQMGIVVVCDGDGITADEAVEQLAVSVTYDDGQISFQIPPQFYSPGGWNIHISGRAEFGDGMSTSIHEFEDVNDSHSWEAGKVYTIPVEGRNLTELNMQIFLPDENGNLIEKSVDMLVVVTTSFDPVSAQAPAASYDSAKITFLFDITGFKGTTELEADETIVSFIDNQLANGITHTNEPADLESNYINRYQIELSNRTGGYSAMIYYDTLYNAAYVVKDGGLYTISTDFARYIDKLFEADNKSTDMPEDAVRLFADYGWTIDYQINAMNNKLGDIVNLSGFNSDLYYFAYNNELSKDIGLDMSGYPGEVDVEIYRLYESMPPEFYPIMDCRGIIVRSGGKIIAKTPKWRKNSAQI